MAVPGPFPEKPTKDSLIENPLLFEMLKPLYQNPSYRTSSFAVLYLRPGMGTYAGWNLDKSRFSASILKVAALYAAYQLRESAKLAAPGMRADVVLRNLETAWKPTVLSAVAGPANFPKLAEIFVPYTSSVEFRDDFRADLKAMASASDTEASGRVISKLGHQYINGALAKQDLFTKQKKGLWLGGNYNQEMWYPESDSKSYYAATPRALLRFLSLLTDDLLISADISKTMKGMTDNFYSERMWLPSEYDDSKSFGKLGWEYMEDNKGTDPATGNRIKMYSDAGVIARTTGRGSYNYGIVIQGLVGWQTFQDLVKELDTVIHDWHP